MKKISLVCFLISIFAFCLYSAPTVPRLSNRTFLLERIDLQAISNNPIKVQTIINIESANINDYCVVSVIILNNGKIKEAHYNKIMGPIEIDIRLIKENSPTGKDAYFAYGNTTTKEISILEANKLLSAISLKIYSAY